MAVYLQIPSIAEFHDEEEVIGGVDSFVQSDYIGMAQQFHTRHLIQTLNSIYKLGGEY